MSKRGTISPERQAADAAFRELAYSVLRAICGLPHNSLKQAATAFADVANARFQASHDHQVEGLVG